MLPSKLLISLKSADELHKVAEFAFPWIDLKDPSVGSLGCPKEELVLDFLEFTRLLLDRSTCSLSVALGELLNDSWRQITPLVSHFDFAKVALSGCSDHPEWTTRAEQLTNQIGGGQRLILVHYADYQLANAPVWQATLEAACRIGSRFVLIDTYDKSAGRLWDWYPPAVIRDLAIEANRYGIQLSIAGSLRMDELSKARTLGATVIGVRGAACQDSSRVDGLDHDRLVELSEIFSNQAVTS